MKSAMMIAAAASAAYAAPVHAQAWQGAWSSSFGELRLIENGDYVYGDYRGGTIEGILDRSTGRMRAIFRNPDGSMGYAELFRSATGNFSGAFDWEAAPLPRHNAGAADRKWSGSRTSSTAPRLTSFTRPASRSAFINSAPAKYRQWITGFSEPAPAAAAPAAAPAAVAAVNPLAARFPKLRDYPADFTPTMVVVELRELRFSARNGGREGFIRDAELYGIYVTCEDQNGARALPFMAGARNQIFNKTRESPALVRSTGSNVVVDENQGIRQFILDKQCLDTPGARFAIQIQTNLVEAAAISTRDRKFGYRSFKFYLSQIPPKDKIGGYTSSTSTQSAQLFSNPSNIWYTNIHINQSDGSGNEITMSGRIRFM